MIITSAKIDGFKNLKEIRIEPDEKYNIIIGKNAQGKTNLLEAMWIMTGCKSFRGSKEKDYIAHDGKSMRSEIRFKDSVRTQKIRYELIKAQNGRSIYLNEVKVRGTGSLFDVFKCIVFTPDDTDIIKGSPERRRSFIDMAASQLNPVSVGHLTKHNALMNQRNAVLKNVIQGKSMREELFVWDKQAAREGTYVSFMRYDYILKLNEICSRLYQKITGGSENLELTYRSDVFSAEDFEKGISAESIEKYYTKLCESTDYDLKFGYTHTGVNRDEIAVKVSGFSAKNFGSQGQIKSAALVIKLAQAEIYSKQSREAPVVFLDDVMGELDESRQRLVFEIIKDMQVFITTCNESALLPEIKGRIFRVNGGRIIGEEENVSSSGE